MIEYCTDLAGSDRIPFVIRNQTLKCRILLTTKTEFQIYHLDKILSTLLSSLIIAAVFVESLPQISNLNQLDSIAFLLLKLGGRP